MADKVAQARKALDRANKTGTAGDAWAAIEAAKAAGVDIADLEAGGTGDKAATLAGYGIETDTLSAAHKALDRLDRIGAPANASKAEKAIKGLEVAYASLQDAHYYASLEAGVMDTDIDSMLDVLARKIARLQGKG